MHKYRNLTGLLGLERIQYTFSSRKHMCQSDQCVPNDRFCTPSRRPVQGICGGQEQALVRLAF